MNLRNRQISRLAPRSRSPAGFSLVEVTLAIGIVAFALLALVGTMPIGLATSQESMQQTVHSHILQRISSDLTMLPFDELDQYTAGTQYYDRDGNPVETSAESIFTVELDSTLPKYPQSDTLENIQSRLKRVAVNIRRTGASQDDATRTTLTIANSGL